MKELLDNKGKKSMMRKIAWLIVVTSLVWGSVEVIYSLYNNEFEIHTAFITSVLGIGVTGKGLQKIFEKDEPEN
jgi:hypothetical protein